MSAHVKIYHKAIAALFMAEGVLSCSKKSAPLWRSNDRKSCTPRAQKEKRHSSRAYMQRAKQICMIIGRLCSKGVRAAESTGRPTGECVLSLVCLRRHTCTPLHPRLWCFLYKSFASDSSHGAAPHSARFNPAHLPLSHPISSASIRELIFKIPCDLPTTNNNII